MAVATIALKNLSRQKRRSFLLAGAIAFGILVVSLVNGLVGGILANTQDNYTTLLSGHIFAINVEFNDKKRMMMEIGDESPYVSAADELGKLYPIRYRQKRTSVFNNATLIFQNNSTWRQIDGVDWAADKFLADQLELVSGSMKDLRGDPGIVLGERTAKSLDVRLGESVIIQVETIYGQQNVVEAPVRAIYKEDQLSSGICYMDRDVVNSMLNMEKGHFNWYIIMMKNFRDIDPATKAFAGLLEKEGLHVMNRDKVAGKGFQALMGDLRRDKDKSARVVVSDLNDQMAGMKGIFDTIRIVSLFVLLMLLLVIMVGLNNTYRIIVWERAKEIGTMRALGMQRPVVSRIFLFEAVFLALAGTLAGILLSTGLLSILSIVSFDKATDFAIFLHKGHLTWSYDFGLLGVSIGLVILLTLFAAISPASKAGKVDPAVALRSVR
ncbi:MAG TPA: FtsX-like permease family protein [Rectinemataceae bacterium]|nr:FtsX-like permease family protein [Rectinemataceae bacterium]